MSQITQAPEQTQDCDQAGLFALRGLPPAVFAFGFSFRKRAIVRRFLANVQVHFVFRTKNLPVGSVLLLWGSTAVPEQTPQYIRIVRLEDGFLRSVGLGADLIHPVSWVIDQSGIYYDARQPSDLELLLLNTVFSGQLLARAALLRERIVLSGLTKYNLGSLRWQRPSGVLTVILVPGQVETDASIYFGAVGITGNLALLQTVRRANPDAYIVYKPHPDVVAGLRAQGQGESAAKQWCDELVVDSAMQEMLNQVDEVHVMTSLTGFEALLRGIKVVCYGQPFYAGWGLSDDVIPVTRRHRLLSLDELVAASLILYPTYVSRRTGKITTPEQALDELVAWRSGEQKTKNAIYGISWWRKIMRIGLRIRGRSR